MFLIAVELIGAEDDSNPLVSAAATTVLYKIDQCAMVEEKIPAMIRSVIAMQSAWAKALLVDRSALHTAQLDGDVVQANEVLVDAFDTDVRPILAEVRERLHVAPNPLAAFRESDERQAMINDRVGVAAGW